MRATSPLPSAAAERALTQGEWPRMSATQRGHLCGGSAISSSPTSTAWPRSSSATTARSLSEACAQIRYMGDYFKYYGGLADKVQGAVIPTDKRGVFTYTKYEPKGVIGDHHAMELAAHADELEARSGARRRMHGSDQAVGIHVGVDARIRAAFCRGGISERRRERRHRTRTRGRRGARRASLGRAYRLHRRRCRGAQDLSARGAQDSRP